MKLSALRLFNVKRFADRGVAIEGIGDGVNVLCAANEYGKSTSFEALHALFFQPYSGTGKDVRNLRPYSGGKPLVEVDVEVPRGRFRITKQYFSGGSARVTDLASGQLIAQADEAEAFISRLIQGGPSGPAGLLWVRQGITEFEKGGRSDDGEQQVRAGLLDSVQGEVEAVTGGRRMGEILARAEAELGLLATPQGRPRAGGKWNDAIEKRDGLAAVEQKLASDVASLRDDLQSRAAAVRRLAELDRPEEVEERRRAVAAAEKAFDEAKAVSEKLRTAEAELHLIRERRARSDEGLKSFRAALERGEALRSRLGEAERRRAAAIEKRQDAARAIEAKTVAVEAAEVEDRTARDRLAQTEAALRARDATRHLTELTRKLTEAEAIRQAVEAAEADLVRLRLPDKAVEALQALEVEIAKLRAVREASRPSVTIAYETGAATRLLMDDEPLKDGEERGYDGEAVLTVPGIGSVTLRANSAVRSDGRLEQAEEKRRAALSTLAVADLDEARARQAMARQQDADMRELQGRLSVLAPDGIPRLKEDIAARSAESAVVLELKEDPTAIRAAVLAAEARRTAARLALTEAEPLRSSAEAAFIAIESEVAALKAELGRVEADLGPPDGRAAREAHLASALAGLNAELAAAEERAAALRATAVDLQSVEAALKRTRSVAAAAEAETKALGNTIAELTGRIGALADNAVEETWRETAEALAAATTRALAFEREFKVLQRLKGALENARSKARELYLMPVLTELRPLLGLLFEDVTIAFDDKRLLPETIERNGLKEEVDRLSGGMREQLSVLTRLAFARLLARDGRPAPVILDDALVFSDDDRIERMFDALHRQSSDLQIIVFSCRQRAFSKLGGNVLRMTDWRP